MVMSEASKPLATAAERDACRATATRADGEACCLISVISGYLERDVGNGLYVICARGCRSSRRRDFGGARGVLTAPPPPTDGLPRDETAILAISSGLERDVGDGLGRLEPRAARALLAVALLDGLASGSNAVG